MKSIYVEKIIEKAARDREEIAQEYNASVSAVVWIGGNKYIVIKNGQQIMI